MKVVKRIAVLHLIAGLTTSPVVAGPTIHTVIWDGSESDSWSDPGNWDLEFVPCNFDSIEFNVVIPPYAPNGGIIRCDVDGSCSIRSLDLGEGNRLQIEPGACLTVEEDASLSGIVDVYAPGSFLATQSDATNAGFDDRTRIWARGGAGACGFTSFECGASAAAVVDGVFLDATGLVTTDVGCNNWAHYPIWASDPGTCLDLSSLAALDSGFNDFETSDPFGCQDVNHHEVVATAGATVDLSNLEIATGPTQVEDYLQFRAEDGGIMLLDSLADITTTGHGRTWFWATGGDLNLPSLQSLSSVSFQADAGGTIDASTTLGVVHDAKPIWRTRFDCNTWQHHLMLAMGAGSTITMPAIEELDSGFNDFESSDPFGCQDSNQHLVVATAGGTINLPGLVTTTGPVQYEDQLQFRAEDSGILLLDSLADITTAGRGRTWFWATGGDLNLPSLQSLSAASFQADTGGTIEASATSGVVYDAKPIWRTRFDCNTWEHYLMLATGAGSTIAMPAIEELDSGFNDFESSDPFGCQDQNKHWIEANDGGRIDLSGVHTVTTPDRSEDQLGLWCQGAGSQIELSSWSSVQGGGLMRVQVRDGGELIMAGWDLVAAPVWMTVLSTQLMEGSASTSVRVLGDLCPDIPNPGPDYVYIELLSSDNLLDVACSIHAGAGLDLLAADGATISIGRRLCMTHDVEDDLALANATVVLDGQGTKSDPQQVEVGGLDFGLACSFGNDNFGFNQLIIGQVGVPTVVELRDDFDNGNTGGGANHEALYLYGANGLRLLGGSVLVINDLNVYLCETQTHINDLFPPDTDEIPFDDGFIRRGNPPIAGDATGSGNGSPDGIVDILDLLQILAFWGPCADCAYCPDIDCDGDVGVNELLIVLANWG